jgi:hypothetical protein
MARQEITHVVGSPMIPVARDQSIEQLKALVFGAGELAAQGINTVAGIKSAQAQRIESEYRLSQAKLVTQSQLEQAKVEGALGQERRTARATSELFEAAQANGKAMQENELNGALALLARTDDDKLGQTAREMGIQHPDNLIAIDQAIGQRIAMRDYPQVLKNFLSDPSKTPREHLAEFMSAANFPSDNQEAGYAETLTRLVRQDEERSIRDRIAAGNKIGAENAVFTLERDAALNAATWVRDPAMMETALKDFHAEVLRFNPGASKDDVQNAFQERVLPHLLQGLGAREQLDLAQRLASFDKNHPYMEGIGRAVTPKILELAQHRLDGEQTYAAATLTERLPLVKTKADLQDWQKAVVAADQAGALNPAQRMDLMQRMEKADKRVDSFNKARGRLSGNPAYAAQPILQEEMEIYEEVIQEYRDQYKQLKGEDMPLAVQLRMESVAGTLSNSTAESINRLISAPVVVIDGQADTANQEQGLMALAQLKEEAPNLFRDRYVDNKDALNPSIDLAVTLVDHGFNTGEVARNLAQIKTADLSEAKTLYTSPDGLDNLLKATDPGFFAFEADAQGVGVKARDFHQQLFNYYYSTSAVANPEARVEAAMKRTNAESAKRYKTVQMPGRKYVINTENLPSELVYAKTGTPTEALTRDFKRLAFNAMLDLSTKTKSDFWDGYLDFDNARTEGGNWLVPLKFLSGVETATPSVIAFPLDAIKRKAVMDNAQENAAKMVDEWIGKRAQ